MENTKIIDAMTSFDKSLTDFHSKFLDYLIPNYVDSVPVAKGISTALRDSAVRMRSAFYQLPEEVRERLDAIGFQHILTSGSDVDLFNLRSHFDGFTLRVDETVNIDVRTLVNRIDAELLFIKDFLSNSNPSKLKDVPKLRTTDYRRN